MLWICFLCPRRIIPSTAKSTTTTTPAAVWDGVIFVEIKCTRKVFWCHNLDSEINQIWSVLPHQKIHSNPICQPFISPSFCPPMHTSTYFCMHIISLKCSSHSPFFKSLRFDLMFIWCGVWHHAQHGLHDVKWSTWCGILALLLLFLLLWWLWFFHYNVQRAEVPMGAHFYKSSTSSDLCTRWNTWNDEIYENENEHCCTRRMHKA